VFFSNEARFKLKGKITQPGKTDTGIPKIPTQFTIFLSTVSIRCRAKEHKIIGHFLQEKNI
jgi:hypothetical protein